MNIIKFKENKFLRNFSLLTIGNFGSRGLAMVTNIILARKMEPENYGEYTIVLTFINIFYFIASLGLNQFIIRSVARDQRNSKDYFRISFILRIGGFFFSALCFAIYGIVCPRDWSTIVVFSILAGTLLESIWECQQNISFGMQKMEWNTVVSLVGAGINVVAFFLLPRKFFSVENVLVIYILLFFIKDLVYYLGLNNPQMLTSTSARRTTISFGTCKNYISESFPFYILMVMGLFTSQFPVVFLENNAGLREVAYFNSANKLIMPMMILVNTIFSAYFPNQSQLFATDREKFASQTKKILLLVALFVSISAFGVSLFRYEIVDILYGQQYIGAVDVMAYQSWYMALYALFCLNGNTLGAADSQKKLAICSIVYAVLSTPILYYSSKFGAIGLSIGFIITSFINLLYIYPIMMKTISNSLSYRYSIKVLGTIFGFMLFSFVIPNSPNNLLHRSILVALIIFVIIKFADKLKQFIK